MGLTGQRSVTQVVKGFSMGKRWLLKEVRYVVFPSLTFNCNNRVHYFNQAWSSKDTDIVEGERGNIK